MTTSSASSANNPARHRLSDAAIEPIASLVEQLNAQTQDAAVIELRQQAFDALKVCGFPSRKDEDWQYTPLDGLLSQDWQLAEADASVDVDTTGPQVPVCRLVFVNGRFRAELSDPLPAGVSEQPFDLGALKARVEKAHDAFELLNLALFQPGVSLKVSGQVAQPLLLVHRVSGDNTVANVFHQIVLEKGAELTLLEQHEGAGALSNCVMDTEVNDGAIYRHLKLQQQAKGAHMAHHFVRQGAGSQFSGYYAALGADVSRHFTHTVLAGEGADMSVNSAGLATGEQVMDTRTFTDHAVAHCTSRQVHKLVVDDAARGVFDGMIHVARGAQKTDGLMDNKNLLLGPKAKVGAKPRLEIYADDVKCSHGSATGQLDANQLFYLRARGIDTDAARLLITTAFLAEPMESLANDALRNWLQQALADKLN